MTDIEEIRKLALEIEAMAQRIGNGTEDDDMSNTFLELADDNTLTGQAYEGLHFAYYALLRAHESMYDVAGNMEG